VSFLLEPNADLVETATVVSVEASQDLSWWDQVWLWVAAWSAGLEELSVGSSDDQAIEQIASSCGQFGDVFTWLESNSDLLGLWVLDVLQSSLVT
jgi:hypothetical protein